MSSRIISALYSLLVLAVLCGCSVGQTPRTDRNLTLPPAIPPQAGPNTCSAALWNCGNLTGAGTIMTDALYNGIKIIRFTDNNDNAHSNCNGPSIGPGGSAEEHIISSDNQIFKLECTGGASVFKVFNPVTYGVGNYCLNGGVSYTSNGGEFTYAANNDTFWGVSGMLIQSVPFTVTFPTCAVGSPTTVADFSHSPPCFDAIISCGAWPGTSQPITGGTNIVPTNNNANHNIMQLIGSNSAGCITGGASEPVWVTNNTSQGLTYTDGTCVWVDIGPPVLGFVAEFGGINSDDSGFAFANNDGGGGQGSVGAIFINYFDRVALKYYHLNVATGNVYTTTCPTDFNCAGETRVYVGNAIPANQNLIKFHNIKSKCTQALAQCWLDIAPQGACERSIQCPNSAAGEYAWLVGTTTISFTRAVTTTPGHKVTGHSTMIGSYGATSQYFKGINFGTLAVTPYFDLTIGSACSPNACSASVPFDQHDSWVADNLIDTGIVCSSALSNNNWLPTLPYQWEIFCFATDGSNTVWRQGREYGTGHGGFSTTDHIGSLSQDLKFFGLTDDWACTLGNSNGTASSVCGLPWQASNTYNLNDYVSPTSNNGAVPTSGTNCTGAGCTYQATSCIGACTSGATVPSWTTNCPNVGNTCTDGNITWTNVNSANNRSDTFIYALLPMQQQLVRAIPWY